MEIVERIGWRVVFIAALVFLFSQNVGAQPPSWTWPKWGFQDTSVCAYWSVPPDSYYVIAGSWLDLPAWVEFRLQHPQRPPEQADELIFDYIDRTWLPNTITGWPGWGTGGGAPYTADMHQACHNASSAYPLPSWTANTTDAYAADRATKIADIPAGALCGDYIAEGPTPEIHWRDVATGEVTAATTCTME